ncbi:MAG TPA: hypothetical protein VGR73_12560 [Bryobacteraceae bacterium]|nr:hypothetical protein [Bryobacteraceae bacterium]
MNSIEPTTERKIRWASILTGGGLAIQSATFLVVHPLAFVAFLGIGCPLVIAGIALYLLSLVSDATQ